jgi:hypothetical protein
MTDLISYYSLEEGDHIIVHVSATNDYGTSDLSPVEVTTVKKVETVPHKPQHAPSRGVLTTTS